MDAHIMWQIRPDSQLIRNLARGRHDGRNYAENAAGMGYYRVISVYTWAILQPVNENRLHAGTDTPRMYDSYTHLWGLDCR